MLESAQNKNKYNPRKAVYIFVEHSYQNILNGMAKGQNRVMRRIIFKFDTAAFQSYYAATS